MRNLKFIAKSAIVLSTILVAVIFYSCNGAAKESVQEGDFKVEFLFEKDGCKIYRFRDGVRYAYWSNCQGRMQSDTYRSTGKGGHTERIESFTNSN